MVVVAVMGCGCYNDGYGKWSGGRGSGRGGWLVAIVFCVVVLLLF